MTVWAEDAVEAPGSGMGGTTDRPGLDAVPGGRVPWTTVDAIFVIFVAFVVYVIGGTSVQLADLASRGYFNAQASAGELRAERSEWAGYVARGLRRGTFTVATVKRELANRKGMTAWWRSGPREAWFRGHVGFWVLPVAYMFLTIPTALMCWLWLILRRRGSWRTLGFALPPTMSKSRGLSSVLGAAVIGLFCVYLGTFVITLLFEFLFSFHIKGNAKELLPSPHFHLTVPQYLVLVFTAAILAPITEETLFRGVLFQAIRSDFNGRGLTVAVTVAALASGAAFGAFHLIGGSSLLYTLPVLVYLGVVLAVLMQSMKSVWASISTHAAVNFIAVTSLFAQHH